MVKELVIVKKPRSGPIPDKPIAFPPLDNLQLELLEVKEKLKKNLPPIRIAPKKPLQVSPKPPIRVVEPKPPVPVPSEEPPSVTPQDEDLVAALGKDESDSIEIDIAEASETAQDQEVEGEDVSKPDTSSTHQPEGTEDAAEPEEDDGLTPQQREAEELNEYLWRFKILKKKYKDRDIPVFNEHDDIDMIKKSYDSTVKDIDLETNVDSYRSYLYGGFMLLEFVSNSWLGIDLSGFTAHQMNIRHKYDVLLIELGERSYNRWGLNLPVEIRLIGYILINAGLFYLGKILDQKGGGMMSEIFKTMTGQPVGTKSSNGDEPRKKMRGPSIRVEDLKGMKE